jgi:hypothetical protein
MNENIDDAGCRSPGSWVLARPLLVFCCTAFVIGFVASRTQAQRYVSPSFRLFFSDTLHMKSWFTTAALLLGMGQLLTAARIYGKLSFLPEGNLYPLIHRWSERAAISLTLPACYCPSILAIGYKRTGARWRCRAPNVSGCCIRWEPSNLSRRDTRFST